MADESQADNDRQFQIRQLYVKDLSFESPAAPDIFLGGNWQPAIHLQLDSEQKHVGETLYEVVLSVTVTAKHDEHTAFLVELKQAGLFDIRGIAGEGLQQLLGSHCPGILFPYARQAVADLVHKGGLPEVVLQPINFEALYAQQRASKSEGDAATPSTSH